jgi:predicted dehydrogenase
MEEDAIDVDRADPLARQLEHFCSVVRGETQPLVTARDGLLTLRVTLAIYEAAQTGRPVHVPLADDAATTANNDVR